MVCIRTLTLMHIHHRAHIEMEYLPEPVSERKKVGDLLLGVDVNRLQHAKDNIIGDVSKAKNFEASQQYLKTILISLR